MITLRKCPPMASGLKIVECFVTCINVIIAAWERKSPGSINPNLGAKLASEEQETLQKSLVEGIVPIQISFSIFETPRLRSVLSQLCPNFIWPKQRTIATIATQLYFQHKQKLIKEISQLPDDTYITVAIDFWTTKDQSQSYIAMVGQWIDPIRFLFCNSLLAFKTLNGAHTGQALAWSVWESLSEWGLIH
ncbi:hypothetical protein O181_005809 [Austropuccinia psidii MF-1]|uniref:HAT C-terminal dimerisation domain-containing protein n=1 Tax=Austropuccinia psidii MF-1 TaxID=1389203 RepID=A0A9Q3BI67_9BASI|nr:hypothetical protein [Austropuccinia psidii MF-1]